MKREIMKEGNDLNMFGGVKVHNISEEQAKQYTELCSFWLELGKEEERKRIKAEWDRLKYDLVHNEKVGTETKCEIVKIFEKVFKN